jgi:KDO2-lipid IV(A) lauroyltransferase
MPKLLYSLRYRVGEYWMRGFVAIFPYLPARIIEPMLDFSAHATFLLLRKYRRRMHETYFAVAGADIGDANKGNRLLRRAWRNFGRGAYETACALFSSREQIRSMVRLEGEEHLRNALAKGKGVIALSAHLGNFTMIGPRLAAEGYSFSALIKEPRDPRFAQLISAYRLKVGVKTIPAKPRRRSVQEILLALRRNETVLVVSDEFKGGGIEVEFLGRTAPAQRGPITLALRTGAPILPMFLTRDDRDHLTLSISPEIDLIRSEDRKAAIAANLATISRILDATVRRYPDQWSWLGFRENGNPELESADFDTSGSQRERRFSA